MHFRKRGPNQTRNLHYGHFGQRHDDQLLLDYSGFRVLQDRGLVSLWIIKGGRGVGGGGGAYREFYKYCLEKLPYLVLRYDSKVPTVAGMGPLGVAVLATVVVLGASRPPSL